MKYPEFIKNNDTIGICALSAGVGHKLNDYLKAYDYLTLRGFKIREEGNIRVNNLRGGSVLERVSALHNLFINSEISMIMCATGGNFLYEILPAINLDIIKNNPKWFMGASDPTSLAYMITTCLDIASIYGLNGSSYEEGYKYIDLNCEIIKGNLVTQYSYDYFQSVENYGTNIFDKKVFWHNNLNVKGRCLGGCLDVIRNLIGTPFENTRRFIEKYKHDGIIWYFDIYNMSSEDVYLTLLQLKAIGYFKYAKAILFGRVLFESNYSGMSYQEAYSLALEDIKYAYDLDIGHTMPKMTLINGAIIEVKINNGKGSIGFRLE